MIENSETFPWNFLLSTNSENVMSASTMINDQVALPFGQSQEEAHFMQGFYLIGGMNMCNLRSKPCTHILANFP